MPVRRATVAYRAFGAFGADRRAAARAAPACRSNPPRSLWVRARRIGKNCKNLTTVNYAALLMVYHEGMKITIIVALFVLALAALRPAPAAAQFMPCVYPNRCSSAIANTAVVHNELIVLRAMPALYFSCNTANKT